MKRYSSMDALRKTLSPDVAVIDERMGPADATCDEPGITVSEAARRELADMGKIEYTYRVQP